MATKHGRYVGGRESKMSARWRSMILRCHDLKNRAYPGYGGRGIAVCDRWRDPETGFDAFLADMGECPGSTFSLDRIDNDAGYSPKNCRWADRSMQMQNRRGLRLIAFRGERVPVAVAARALGVSHAFLLMRLNAGWSDEDAINRPHDGRRSPVFHQIEVHGETISVPEAARRFGISAALIRKRIAYGKTGSALIDPSDRRRRASKSEMAAS